MNPTEKNAFIRFLENAAIVLPILLQVVGALLQAYSGEQAKAIATAQPGTYAVAESMKSVRLNANAGYWAMGLGIAGLAGGTYWKLKPLSKDPRMNILAKEQFRLVSSEAATDEVLDAKHASIKAYRKWRDADRGSA